VKYWEIIADNLSKAGWSLGLLVSDRLSPSGQSGLPTRIAAMESVSLCVQMKADRACGIGISDSGPDVRLHLIFPA
jgi:hypothetical protein